MNEWMLLGYPVVLIGALVLAARWQPKDSPAPVDEPGQDDQAR